MFGVSGAGLSVVKYFANDRKAPRRGIDAWDRVSFLLPSLDHSVLCDANFLQQQSMFITFIAIKHSEAKAY